MNKENFNADEMINATRKLSAILSIEVQMLKKMQITKIHHLYEQKIALANILEKYKEMLIKNPAIIKSLPKRVIDEMRAEYKNFEGLLAEEKQGLNKAMKVRSVVMDLVKNAIAKRVSMNEGYNKNGGFNYGHKQVLKTPAISFNQDY